MHSEETGGARSKNLYKIVFEGKVAPGADPDAVRANLADLFGIDAAEVQKLFNRSPDVIKWNADEKTARGLLATLDETGALAHMELQEPRDQALQCPSCGYVAESEEDPLVRGAGGQGECPSCGVVVARFRAGEKEAQAKKAEPENPREKAAEQKVEQKAEEKAEQKAEEKPALQQAEEKPAPKKAEEKPAPKKAAPEKAEPQKAAAPAKDEAKPKAAKPEAPQPKAAKEEAKPAPAAKKRTVADEEEAPVRTERPRPASMGRRFLAFVCDLSWLLCLWGLLLPLAGLAWRLLYGPVRADGPLLRQLSTLFTNVPIQIALGWGAAALLSFMLIFLIVPLFSGRTPGQRTAGIEVMRNEDRSPGAFALILRFIGYAVSYAGVVILFLAPAILPGGASLADVVSGTRQQEERQYLSGEAMMAFLPIFGAVLAVGLGIPLAALAVGILG